MNSPEELYSVRLHMSRNPDHELTIGEDDEWRCLTCEAEEDTDANA